MKLLKRFPHAIRGVAYAIANDFGFRTQFYSGIILSGVMLFVLNPLTTTEFLFLGVAAMFVLITELQNSAFEHALDQLHPEKHDKIRDSKDMAAGSVLLAACFALLVILVLTADRFVF